MKSESGFSLAMANQPFKSKPRPGGRNQKSLKICFRRRNLNFLKVNLMNSLDELPKVFVNFLCFQFPVSGVLCGLSDGHG